MNDINKSNTIKINFKNKAKIKKIKTTKTY